MIKGIDKQILLITIFLLNGCLPGVLTDEGRSSSGTFIEDFTLNKTTEGGECGENDPRNFNEVFIDTTFTKCLDKCEESQHITVMKS